MSVEPFMPGEYQKYNTQPVAPRDIAEGYFFAPFTI